MDRIGEECHYQNRTCDTGKGRWEDIKTFFKFIKNLDKLAIVGNSSVVEKTAKVSKPFVSGEVKFFSEKEAITAREWVKEDAR